MAPEAAAPLVIGTSFWVGTAVFVLAYAVIISE